MNVVSKLITDVTGNMNVKCKFCSAKVKKKEAHVEKIKLLEYVYPKETAFCSKLCCDNYKTYEENVPKKRSLCSMCPTHPDA